MRNCIICFILIFITSTLYSQTDINEIKENRPRSIDSMLHYRQQSIRERLQPPILIIDNPKWLEYIDVDDKTSSDFFTNIPIQELDRNELAPSKNNVIKFIAGGVGGALIGLPGGLIGFGLEDCSNGQEDYGILDEFEFCGIGGFLIGGLIGYHFGTAAGVYIVGNISNENGSYGSALLGSTAWQIVGSLIFAVNQNYATGVFWFASAPIGATVEYNRSRKIKSKNLQSRALINLNGRKIELAPPMIYFNRLHSTNRLVQMVDILHVDL